MAPETMNMKVDYPGLLMEKLPSGSVRYRVRVEGDPRKRIRVHIDPDHKDFIEHYHAARAGVAIAPHESPEQKAVTGSVAWLTYRYLKHLEQQVTAGQASGKTLKAKKQYLRELRVRCGEFSMAMPTSEVVTIRDGLAHKPAAADAMTKAISSMYRWAISMGICSFNPAQGVGNIDRDRGGAIPWTIGDRRKFRDTHASGTTAYAWLTLQMFTACRIEDAAHLGRANEYEYQGMRWIGWQPRKRGSVFVDVPMMPQLIEATRSTQVQGPTYLLTDYGKPFKSADALGARVRKWCDQAGLERLSSHGVRKAAGELLAEHGCSQYEIMSVHGHAQAKTSEIYTSGVERKKLALRALDSIRGMEW